MNLQTLYKKLREHTLHFGEQEEAAEAVALIFATQEDVVKAVCPDCANGVYLNGNMHILETIQGYPAHERSCLAVAVRVAMSCK